MAKTISLREANQRFARCIREVEAGSEFVITRNGQSVERGAGRARRCCAAERMSCWDGLLLATAREAGCAAILVAILTEDLADGAELGGVRIHNPFAAGGG